jgi:hypothetical protein
VVPIGATCDSAGPAARNIVAAIASRHFIGLSIRIYSALGRDRPVRTDTRSIGIRGRPARAANALPGRVTQIRATAAGT